MVAFAQPELKTIEIEWEEVPNAESYIVKLTPVPEKTAPPAGTENATLKPTVLPESLYFTTKEAKLNQQVPVGLYELRIRSRSHEADVFSKWSDPVALEVATKDVKPLSPTDKAVIEAKNKATEAIEFKWTPVEKVKEYTITVWTSDAKDKPFEFKTKNTSKTLTVKTGRDYFWQVNFDSATDVSYAQMPPIFSFTLVGSKLIKPLDIKQARVGEEHQISWSASEDARTYQAKLSFHFLDENEFKPLKNAELKNGLWNVGKLKAGAYRLEIIARAPQRVDSDVSALEFMVKPTEAQLLH